MTWYDGRDWRLQFPGDGAAAMVLSFIESTEQLIREGKVSQARDALWSTGWKDRMDLTGLPPRVEERTQLLVDLAWDSLREPYAGSAGAVAALEEIRRIFSASGQ